MGEDEIIVDIDLGRQGQVVHKNNRILLVDADTIIFASVITLEQETELFGDDFYTKDELKDLEEQFNKPYQESGAYIDDDGQRFIYSIDLDQAYDHATEKLQGILDETGCQDYELHFTVGRKGFMYEVDPNYKANRTGRSPFGLVKLKELFKERQPDKVTLNDKWEADHIVVAKKRDNPDKYTLTAVDKDVLYTLPTTEDNKHFNYYSNTQYNIPMKWVEVTEIEALKHHYLQTLTGDSQDGIVGLKGIGPVKASKLLEGITSEVKLWEAVVDAYDNIGVLKNGEPATIINALINMRLVNMHQLKLNDKGEYEICLWKPTKI